MFNAFDHQHIAGLGQVMRLDIRLSRLARHRPQRRGHRLHDVAHRHHRADHARAGQHRLQLRRRNRAVDAQFVHRVRHRASKIGQGEVGGNHILARPRNVEHDDAFAGDFSGQLNIGHGSHCALRIGCALIDNSKMLCKPQPGV